ncbi:MAG: ABC transporter permease [Acidobacteriota bacterium]
MRPLTRKLWRDVLAQRGPAAAIALVIGSGIALYVLMVSCFWSLERTRETYYERYRFADVFARLERAPQRLEREIAAIPGVARVRTRVVRDVALDVPDLEEAATARMISIPARRRPMLCDVFLRAGRYVEPGETDEVLVSEEFAAAHGLGPGDTIHAVIGGSRRPLRIVGLALTPEYVYTIRPGDVLPDSRRFAIVFMELRRLAAALSMEGGFNDVVLRLSPTADRKEVIRRLDDLLEPYGGRGAIPRRLQMSHWYLENELDGLRKFGRTIPVVFLVVAAFLLHVVMSRLVSVQREQIAQLKAIGYSNRDLALHYAGWSLVVAALGAAFGLAAGAWFGAKMTSMYTEFFHFPLLEYHLPPRVIVEALAVGAAAALLGGQAAVRRAVRLPPAEAMRPEPPRVYRRSVLERAGLGGWLSPATRITVRSLERTLGRTTITVFGISAGAALLIGGTFTLDGMDAMLDLQFNVAQRYDALVTFYLPASPRAIEEIAGLPGVIRAEGFRTVAARFRHRHRLRHGVLTGLEPGARLRQIVSSRGRRVPLPARGVLMSAKLAEVLGIRPGEALEVEVLEGRRPRLRLPVAGLVDEPLGTEVYISRDELHALLDEPRVLSGAHVLLDAAGAPRFHRRLKNTPMVAGVVLSEAAIRSFEDTLERTVGIVRTFNVMFAVIIAFGVVYNAARISLAERTRDLATLRVIGFRRREIAEILLGELAIVTLLAIPFGLAGGWLMAWIVVRAYDTELFRMPLVILPRTYATAVIAVLVAAVLSGAAVRRKLQRLDLIAVLKTRE